jgi:hypothetical protein
MYLLYVDESGNSDGTDDQYFVLGGIAAFERKIYWLNEAVDLLERRIFGTGFKVEFHAQAITSHQEDPWRSLNSTTRKQTLESLCRIISDPEVVLFGIAVEKATNPEPMARAFEELCNRFDLFLKRLHAQGNTQRGLIIFDETRYETKLQTLLLRYRESGTRFGKVANFADVPFFADSRSTRLLQLADLTAYSVYRRYERSNTWLIDQIISRFDTEGGVIHGLLHLTANRSSCTCPACLTRRLAPRG